MYERLRNDLIKTLSSKFEPKEIEKIALILDMVAYRYDVTEKEMALATIGDIGNEMVKTYLAVKAIEGCSDLTLRNYKYHLDAFFNYVRKSPAEVQANDIRIYLYRYGESHRIKEASLDKIREYICRLFKWCSEEGYIETNPAKSIKPIKHENAQRHSMTQDDLEKIRDSCNTKRERAIVEMLYSTACRVSELSGLKMSDVTWETKEVHLFGKGKKEAEKIICGDRDESYGSPEHSF